MTTFADKRCDGYGIAAHLTDGGLIATLQPVALRLCGPCWRRWIDVHEPTGNHHHQEMNR